MFFEERSGTVAGTTVNLFEQILLINKETVKERTGFTVSDHQLAVAKLIVSDALKHHSGHQHVSINVNRKIDFGWHNAAHEQGKTNHIQWTIGDSPRSIHTDWGYLSQEYMGAIFKAVGFNVEYDPDPTLGGSGNKGVKAKNPIPFPPKPDKANDEAEERAPETAESPRLG